MITISEIYFFIIIALALEAFVIFILLEDLEFFDPCRNYKKWKNMNWFGVIFFTILLNIALPVYALIYWFLKLCRVGRYK